MRCSTTSRRRSSRRCRRHAALPGDHGAPAAGAGVDGARAHRRRRPPRILDDLYRATCSPIGGRGRSRRTGTTRCFAATWARRRAPAERVRAPRLRAPRRATARSARTSTTMRSAVPRGAGLGCGRRASPSARRPPCSGTAEGRRCDEWILALPARRLEPDPWLRYWLGDFDLIPIDQREARGQLQAAYSPVPRERQPPGPGPGGRRRARRLLLRVVGLRSDASVGATRSSPSRTA